jgi:hypothetical protein
MLVHPDDPDLYLLEMADLRGDAFPPRAAVHQGVVAGIVRWAHEYLSQPHPDLGRPGPVCPYVQTSLRGSHFYLTVRPGRRPDRAAVEATVLRFRDWFGVLEPTSGRDAQFKTILIVFPDVAAEEAPELIDATQYALKPAFVAAGLMIGQFHPLPPRESGLWNPDFRPLRSPYPLLAIRHMVHTDLPFLAGERRFLESYRTVFGDTLPARQRADLAKAMGR